MSNFEIQLAGTNQSDSACGVTKYCGSEDFTEFKTEAPSSGYTAPATVTKAGAAASAAVAELQQALVDGGYDVGSAGVDGILGAKTQMAIEKAAGDFGLSVAASSLRADLLIALKNGGSIFKKVTGKAKAVWAKLNPEGQPIYKKPIVYVGAVVVLAGVGGIFMAGSSKAKPALAGMRRRRKAHRRSRRALCGCRG